MPTTPIQVDSAELRNIPVSAVRRDGQTQHRSRIDLTVVAEYAELMQDGVVFPPIRVWWDGADYWLSDGFHRVAAAEEAGAAEISAEIHLGSLSEAQWDSFSANSCHGLRRSIAENHHVVQLALAHARAAQISNVELARHLHVSEKTIRRWRKTPSSAHAEDSCRVVTRDGTTYPMATGGIGRTRSKHRAKSPERTQ